ncbi:hypothetical protein, partial [Prevotella corporis]|uniref:hypothetical protein n=1 Tax=Prevotella corporis TaxID=28128 RepID=UPI001EE1613F
ELQPVLDVADWCKILLQLNCEKNTLIRKRGYAAYPLFSDYAAIESLNFLYKRAKIQPIFSKHSRAS